MYLDEVIENLLEIKKKHGNIIVKVSDNESFYGYGYPVEKIIVRENVSNSILDETYTYVGIES